MPPEQTNGSLYGRVLNRDGTVALIAVMLLSFFIYVYWDSLQKIQQGQTESKEILSDIRDEMVKLNDKTGAHNTVGLQFSSPRQP